jgi:hypothetical protein
MADSAVAIAALESPQEIGAPLSPGASQGIAQTLGSERHSLGGRQTVRFELRVSLESRLPIRLSGILVDRFG